MQPCILCLPITLPSEVKPGLVLTPFVVSTISTLTRLIAVCCVNLTGLRYESIHAKEVSVRFKKFQKLLARLGTPISQYWADNDPRHITRLQRYCEELAEIGDLKQNLATTFICQCGAVEVAEEAITSDWTMDRKVMYSRNGRIFCKLCGTQLHSTRKECLFLDSHFGGNPLVTIPGFYQKEVDMLQNGFNQPLLVSRQRKGCYRVSLFNRTWRLDTDFCWSLLFCSLVEDGFDPQAVVISSRSLKPLVWSFGVSRKLHPELNTITAVVTPYVRFETTDPKSPIIGSIMELLDRYGRVPVRLLLGCGLKWN